MSYSGRYVKTIAVGGTSIAAERTFSGDAINEREITLAAGVSGTAGGSGVMTLGEGHGITDADTVDVFASGSVTYGCTVSSYDSTTITLTGGSGDSLPTSGAVVVSVRTAINVAFDADDIVLIAASCNQRCNVDFNDAGGSEFATEIVQNDSWTWDNENGTTNPMAGDDIVAVYAGNGSTSSATLKIAVLFDSTP